MMALLSPAACIMRQFRVGSYTVTFLTMEGVRRLILDFESGSDGEPDLITVVTAREGAWRLFADGSEHGTRPSIVNVTGGVWRPESPTVDDLGKKG